MALANLRWWSTFDEPLANTYKRNLNVVTGKFDQIRSRQPFSALFDAFTELCDQILVSHNPQSLWELKRRIQEAVRTQGRILTDLLPSLLSIIGDDCQQPEIQALPEVQARNRFNYLFRHFVWAISSPERPLILFLDDLQWGDESSRWISSPPSSATPAIPRCS